MGDVSPRSEDIGRRRLRLKSSGPNHRLPRKHCAGSVNSTPSKHRLMARTPNAGPWSARNKPARCWPNSSNASRSSAGASSPRPISPRRSTHAGPLGKFVPLYHRRPHRHRQQPRRTRSVRHSHHPQKLPVPRLRSRRRAASIIQKPISPTSSTALQKDTQLAGSKSCSHGTGPGKKPSQIKQPRRSADAHF